MLPSPGRVAASLAVLWLAAAPAVGQTPGAPGTPALPGVDAARPRALFDLGWDSGKPLSIRSDELEYVQAEGSRRLLFRNNVRVEQDGLTITSERLEAIYPPKGNQPNRLVAEGDVRLAKGDRVARCARATYDRTNEVLTCEGAAEVQEGQSRLSGDVIEIDLAADRLRVRGAAAVSLEAGLLKEGGVKEGGGEGAAP
jgi:lipopolysaccharide transport protein LptA